MRRFIAYGALALLTTLAACSHGSNSALPGQQSGNTPNALRQKMLREQQRVPSTFVAPKHPGYMAESPQAQTAAAGIQEAGQAPVPGGMFDIVNQYNTIANGQRITVYAGSLKTTGAGIVLVVTRSLDLHTARAQTYTVAEGPVRIESAAGGQVQLQTLNAQHQTIPFRMPL